MIKNEIVVQYFNSDEFKDLYTNSKEDCEKLLLSWNKKSKDLDIVYVLKSSAEVKENIELKWNLDVSENIKYSIANENRVFY